MREEYSITRIQDYVGKKIEIIAFDISYRGILEEVDLQQGTLKLVDADDFVILEIERVESFRLVE